MYITISKLAVKIGEDGINCLMICTHKLIDPCFFVNPSAKESDTTQEIEDKLQVLLSESNKQQQDLDRTLNDLSSLKFGYAFLQQDNIEQAKRFQQLMWINHKLLWLLKHQHEKLDDIEEDLQEKAETLEEIEGRVHPCGGTGWRLIRHFDMRNPDTECPPNLAQISGIPVRACGRTYNSDCDSLRMDINEEYRMMCGRVKAFQIGDGGAFSAQVPAPTLRDAYVMGY